MAFHITQATRAPEGGWIFEETEKVRLTGAAGPLARHIIGLEGSSDGKWTLSAAEIAKLLCQAPSAEATPMLLWNGGEAAAVPMRVHHFCGVSREFETELLVHMEILEPATGGLQGTGVLTNEALRLLGGRLTPKARWVWAAPKMSIGSTVVGPNRRHLEVAVSPG